MRRNIGVMIVAALAALAAACDWDTPVSITPPTVTLIGSGSGTVTPVGGDIPMGDWGTVHIPEGAVQTPEDVRCDLLRPADTDLRPGELVRLSCGPHGLDFPDEKPMRMTIRIEALPEEVRQQLADVEPGQPLAVVYTDDPADKRTAAVAVISPDRRAISLKLLHFSEYSLQMIEDLLDPVGVRTRALGSDDGADGPGAFVAYTNELDEEAIFSRGGGSVACLVAGSGIADEGCRRDQWEAVLDELVTAGFLQDSGPFAEAVATVQAGVEIGTEVVDFTGAAVTTVRLDDDVLRLMREHILHWPQKATLRNVYGRVDRVLDKLDKVEGAFLLAKPVLELFISTAVTQGESLDRIEALDDLLLLDPKPALGASVPTCSKPARWKPSPLASDRAFREALCATRKDLSDRMDSALDAALGHVTKALSKSGFVADLAGFSGELSAQWVLTRAFGVTPLSAALAYGASLIVEAVIDSVKLTDSQQQRALLVTFLTGAEHGSAESWLKQPRRTDDGYRLDGVRLETASYAERLYFLLSEQYHTTADVGTLTKLGFFLYDLLADEYCVSDEGDELRPEGECSGDSFKERDLRAWYALKRAESALETVQAIRGNLLHGTYGDLYDEPPVLEPIESTEIRMPVDGLLVETCETPVDSGSTYFDGTCSSQFTTMFKGRYEGYAALRGKGSGCHPGLDLPVPRGTLVYAGVHGEIDARIPRNGKTGYNGGWGGLVIVRNTTIYKEPIYVIYAHLDEVLVTPGMVVTPDTPIGRSGNTGHSTGAHLHWQIDRDTVGSLKKQAFLSPYFPSAGTEDPSKCNVDNYALDPLDIFVKKLQGKDVSSL